jgi:hypothetical protein
MPDRDITKGASYRLNYNTGTYASEIWAHMKSVGDLAINPNIEDIVVPDRSGGTGHLPGEDDTEFVFTLYEDQADANVEALIAALFAKTMVHLAVSRGNIATTGVKFMHMECALFADLSANRPDPSSYQVTARKHANSENAFARDTV